MSSFSPAAKKSDSRSGRAQRLLRPILFTGAVLIAACAQQPQRPPDATPATAPVPTVTETKPAAPVIAPKPKPKPKPAPPKLDPKDSDVTPTPAPAPAPSEGIDSAQVGYYFDTLQGRLRQLGDRTIVISRSDGHISADITQRVHFAGDDAPLPAGECAALAPLAKVLVEYKLTRVIVEVDAASADEPGVKTARVRMDALMQCLADSGVNARRVRPRPPRPSAHPATILHIEPIVKSP